MFKALSVAVLLLSISAYGANKENLKRLRSAIEAAPAVKDSFSIQKTKNGVRYFVGMFGPCACVTDNLIATCVRDLTSILKGTLKKSNEDRKIECDPRVGCTMGTRTVYVECPTAGDSITNF